MMALVVSDRELSMAEAGRTWKVECFGASISSQADFKIGMTTPDKEIVVLTRDYSSTVAGVFASLYKIPWSGGTDARQLNLRLKYTTPLLMEIKEGVTATLGTVITSATIRASNSSGNANASLPGDLKPLILEANSDYVVSLQNIGANTGDIGLSFYFRTSEPFLTFNQPM